VQNFLRSFCGGLEMGQCFLKEPILRFCKEKLFKSESIKYFILCYIFWLIDWLKTVPALKGPKPALDFGKAGLEGLPRPGNPDCQVANTDNSLMLAPDVYCQVANTDNSLMLAPDVYCQVANTENSLIPHLTSTAMIWWRSCWSIQKVKSKDLCRHIL
jgi:hypothetical protein